MEYNILLDLKTLDTIDVWRRKHFYTYPDLDNDWPVNTDVLKTL